MGIRRSVPICRRNVAGDLGECRGFIKRTPLGGWHRAGNRAAAWEERLVRNENTGGATGWYRRAQGGASQWRWNTDRPAATFRAKADR